MAGRYIFRGVLGATGAVGQRLISHLADHPVFEVVAVMASERSAGKTYGEACDWRLPGGIPKRITKLEIKRPKPFEGVDVVFSGIGAEPARELEPLWAEAGAWVFSNARAYRMESDVPLVIPEVNPDHFELIEAQRKNRGWSGAIVTNANCSTTFLAMALAPLQRAFGIESVFVSTLQAVSGAGYRGVSSMEILGNIVPYIGGEEEKMESETQKILGSLGENGVTASPFTVSAHANRVPVLDGHTLTVSVGLGTRASVEDVTRAIEEFSGPPQELGLHSAPSRPLIVMEEADRPQPALDAYLEGGMATTVGRIRPCNLLDMRMVVMGHNTVRGAGPGSVLNAEYAAASGLMEVPT